MTATRWRGPRLDLTGSAQTLGKPIFCAPSRAQNEREFGIFSRIALSHSGLRDTNVRTLRRRRKKANHAPNLLAKLRRIRD